MEVGGSNPHALICVVAGQRAFGLVRDGFQLAAGYLSWPLMAVIARPRRALAPFPRLGGLLRVGIDEREACFSVEARGVFGRYCGLKRVRESGYSFLS